MKRNIRNKCIAFLTAASFVCGGASFQCSPIASAEEEIGTPLSELQLTLNETQPDDFMALSMITLRAYCHVNAGLGDPLSATSMEKLDINDSGTLDIMDAITFLTWFTTGCAYGTFPDEAQEFINNWEIPPATPITPLETTTTSIPASTSSVSTTTAATSTVTEPISHTTITTVPSAIAETTTIPSATAIATESTADTETISSTLVTTTTTTTTTTATTKITTTATTTSVYNGIDVSRYQGNIDWEAVKASGKDFALIRAGYGKYASQEDPYFDQNMKGAQAAGIACGAYWFSYAESVADAIQEASVFADVIEGYQFEYPLVFDIEAPVHTTMSSSEIGAIIKAFCTEMENRGYFISLYSYANFLNTKVPQDVLERYDIWVAHFDVSKPNYTKTKYGIWQYSSTGSVSGISGNVDLDYSYRDYLGIMVRAHKNGY